MAVAHRRQILLHPVNDVLAVPAPLTVEREVAQRRFVRRLSELLKEVVVDVAGVPADIVHPTGPPPPMTALTFNALEQPDRHFIPGACWQICGKRGPAVCDDLFTLMEI